MATTTVLSIVCLPAVVHVSRAVAASGPTVSEYLVPDGGGTPLAGGCSAITGPDGDVWFPEFERGWIGRYNPTTHVITQEPLPTLESAPGAVIVDSQGYIWTDEFLGDKIARDRKSVV